MSSHTLSQLTDVALTRDLAMSFVQGDRTDAAQIAHVAEFDARKLYLPAGYPSMFAYCLDKFRLTEQSAYKRIRAARIARQCPAIFAAMTDGWLNLSAVVMLTPHLTPQNADELIESATHKTVAELEVLLANRFPKPDVPTRLAPVGPPSPQLSSRTVGRDPLHELLSPTDAQALELSSRTVVQDSSPELSSRTVAPAKVAPLAPQRFSLQATIDQETHDLLREAQSMQGHQVAEVLKRALAKYVGHERRRKFAATAKPRTGPRRGTATQRHIPAHVKRAVYARDQGQCTFVGDTGRRCASRKCLEFDHVQEVARGGEASVANIRLRCRGHNQYEAERTFGTGFMIKKRDEARGAGGSAAEAPTRWPSASPPASRSPSPFQNCPAARPCPGS